MKVISFLVYFSLLFSASTLLGQPAPSAPSPVVAYRDPGTGPVVPWPLDFSRDTLFDNELLGTWKSAASQGENPWLLTLARSPNPGIYSWTLNSVAHAEVRISGVGRIENDILIGYWHTTSGGFGTITVHMLSGKVYLKMGFSKEQIFELTFDHRDSPTSIQ